MIKPKQNFTFLKMVWDESFCSKYYCLWQLTLQCLLTGEILKQQKLVCPVFCCHFLHLQSQEQSQQISQINIWQIQFENEFSCNSSERKQQEYKEIP